MLLSERNTPETNVLCVGLYNVDGSCNRKAFARVSTSEIRFFELTRRPGKVYACLASKDIRLSLRLNNMKSNGFFLL